MPLNKMQPASEPPCLTGCKGEIPRQQFQEDCMATLVFPLFNASDMSGFGLWMFLSIGAVALSVVFIPLVHHIDSQRKEREAFYKAETLRRIAESTTEGGK